MKACWYPRQAFFVTRPSNAPLPYRIAPPLFSSLPSVVNYCTSIHMPLSLYHIYSRNDVVWGNPAAEASPAEVHLQAG